MTTASDIVTQLDRLYTASVARLQAALNAYLVDGVAPDPQTRGDGSFAYPEIRLTFRGSDEQRPTPMRSYGRLVTPGDYRISVTKPAMFADYLTEQLTLLMEDYDVDVEAVTGRQEIPFPYVLDPGHALSLDEVSAAELARHFPATELAQIGDEIENISTVRVAVVNPGATRTKMRARAYPGEDPQSVKPPEVVGERLAELIVAGFPANHTERVEG
jgi:AMP nucleosidase